VSRLLPFLIVALAAQQAPPPSEIYLLAYNGDGKLDPNPINISNSPGYDNQPSFVPDGSAILFTSHRGEVVQTDIYKYDLKTKTVTQVTKTPESEYSPIVTPDGKTFSVIRVEADGTQRLWRFDLDGSNPRLVLTDVKPVGYHVWVDATHLLLFVLGGQGQPNTLQFADTTTGRTAVIDTNIGRSLLMRPRTGTASYVSKPAGGHWVVKEFDPKTLTTSVITPTADENLSEDYAWASDGALLMPSGLKLMGWMSATGWREFADFSSIGPGRITRLAVTPRSIAFVK
jgi:dipeptidyl aminopeptidase/acylaminoacyl peptidase